MNAATGGIDTITLGDGTNVGNLTLTGTVGLGTSVRSLTVSSGVNLTLNGVISGTAGGITKLGTGTLTLGGASANTFTGATTVSEGTLATTTAGRFTTTSGVSVAAGATLRLGANETLNSLTTINTVGPTTGSTINLNGSGVVLSLGSGVTSLKGIVSGTGNLTKNSTGTLTLDAAGAFSHSGTTTISNGTLAYAADDQLVGPVVVSGGTFAISTFNDTVASVQLTGGSITGTTGVLTSSATFDVQSGTVSAILAGAVGLTKSTAGSVTLSGANTYTGTTTVNAGTLQLGAANVIADTSDLTVNAGTFNLGGFADTVGNVSLVTGTISNGTPCAASVRSVGRMP